MYPTSLPCVLGIHLSKDSLQPFHVAQEKEKEILSGG